MIPTPSPVHFPLKESGKRKILIDTDTASDDAAALIMGLLSQEIEIVAITSVRGNVSAHQAALNALMTVQVCKRAHPPVFIGTEAPLKRSPLPGGAVHGRDGMGDCGLIHPEKKPESMAAVDAILKAAARYPGDMEILAIGPVSNIALALKKDPETMKKVKRIYTMGTGGFGPGNVTPYAEFNVYADPEAYEIMIASGIPLRIIGFDVCGGKTFFNREDIDRLRQRNSALAAYLLSSSGKLLQFNLKMRKQYGFSLPDAVAMAVLLDQTILQKKCRCRGSIHTVPDEKYGMVTWTKDQNSSVEVCRSLDTGAFKKLFFSLL